MRLELDIFGGDKLRRRLTMIGVRTVDARPAFRAVVDELRASEKRLFDTKGSSSGSPWRPLALSTVRSKRGSRSAIVRRNATRTMVATGELRESLTRKGGNHIEHVTRDGFEFGTRVSYAKYHQPDPQHRRVILMSQEQRREATRTLRRYLLTGRVR